MGLPGIFLQHRSPYARQSGIPCSEPPSTWSPDSLSTASPEPEHNVLRYASSVCTRKHWSTYGVTRSCKHCALSLAPVVLSAALQSVITLTSRASRFDINTRQLTNPGTRPNPSRTTAERLLRRTPTSSGFATNSMHSAANRSRSKTLSIFTHPSPRESKRTHCLVGAPFVHVRLECWKPTLRLRTPRAWASYCH